MEERDTVSEKIGVLYSKMYPIVGNHKGTVDALLFGLNNERDTLNNLIEERDVHPIVFKTAARIACIDQLIEKLKTL